MQLNLGQRLPCAHQKNTNTCARCGGLAALGSAAGVRAAAARCVISSPPNAAYLQASMAPCFSTSSEETSRKVLCARARRRAEITVTAPAKGVLYLPRRARCHLNSLCGRQSLSPLACSGEAAGKRRDYAHAVFAATLTAADELRTQRHPSSTGTASTTTITRAPFRSCRAASPSGSAAPTPSETLRLEMVVERARRGRRCHVDCTGRWGPRRAAGGAAARRSCAWEQRQCYLTA
jgi:hypothetical protein